jgi:hypothetical protein
MIKVSYESGMVWTADGRLFVPSASDAEQDPYEITVDKEGNLACECVGARRYWERCRHEERAAYFLEHRTPRTPEQRAFWDDSYGDRLRVDIRAGERPERKKRLRKSEADLLAREAREAYAW